MDHYDYRLAPTSKAELSPIYTFARTQSTIASYHRSRQPIRVSRDIDVLGIYRVIDPDAEIANSAFDPIASGHRVDYVPHCRVGCPCEPLLERTNRTERTPAA